MEFISSLTGIGNFIWMVLAAFFAALWWIFNLDGRVKDHSKSHEKTSEKLDDITKGLNLKASDSHLKQIENRVNVLEKVNISIDAEMTNQGKHIDEILDSQKSILKNINQIQLHLAKIKTIGD